jgi:NitT/TauT family transport system substrate-binding protein
VAADDPDDDLPPCEQTELTHTQPVHSLGYAPVYVARVQGMFEEVGLEVEQINTGGGGPDLQALLAGEAQFNSGSGTYQLDALQQEQEVTTVYNYRDLEIVDVTLSHEAAEEAGVTEDSPLEDRIEALRGLTSGATRPVALTYYIARAIARVGGMDPDTDVEIIGAGSGAEIIAAFAQGQVDAILVTQPQPFQAVHEGHGIELISNSEGEISELVPFSGGNIYTTPEFVEEHRGCVERYVAAIHEANQWFVDNDVDTVADALEEEFDEFDREVLDRAVELVQAATNPSGELDPAAVENTIWAVEAEGEIDVDEVMEHYTDEFIPGG